MMETDKQEGPFWTTHDFYHGGKKNSIIITNITYMYTNMQHFLIEIHLTSIINYQHYKFINFHERLPLWWQLGPGKRYMYILLLLLQPPHNVNGH